MPAKTFNGRAVLDRYCTGCHNTRLKTAGLLLDQADVDHPGSNPELWEKVVRKLRSGAMPPAGLPRPDKGAYDSFASYLESALDQEWIAHPNPGYPAAVHRLNRIEYVNAIRDLLALELEASGLLPPDDAGYGFDNIGDVLSMSPARMERYISAARKISRLAVGDITMRPGTDVYKLLEAPVLMQNDRMSEDQPFGTRGGLAVRHQFPLDGEYVLKIRLQRSRDNRGEIRGLAEEQSLDVRVDGARIKTFTVGRKTGPLPPADNIQLGIGNAPADRERWEYEIHADDGLEVRFPAKAGSRLVQVAFEARDILTERGRKYQLPAWGFAVNRGGNPDIDRVSISGPFNATGSGDTASRREIFVCQPHRAQEEDACATKILTRLARRAYRRPTTGDDVRTLMSFYKSGRAEGSFDTGIEAALRRLLVDPDFLFRVEAASETSTVAPHPVSNFDLASRLSFFLWSSIPDDTLLDLAASGQIKKPAVLVAQIRRMLTDSRSKALVSNFAGQWLYLRNLRTVAPDPVAFPEFDENLRDAFQQETELFIDSMLREDRSVVELLSANYTFVNERLAKHYQIPNVYGSHFRRVQLTDDRRGGLLGQGSILTATSYTTRTSPTVRGKWLLENILGAPPPPPPPNVPSLQANDADGKPKSVREAMEQHRKNPVCASCHAQMDPLGFALENFNGIGQWRSKSEANTPIDAAAVLPDGAKFDGPAELRKLLVSHRQEFAQTVVEKLLTYALGRGLEYYDAPAVRKIVRDAAPADYSWSSLIIGIVKSAPFEMRGAVAPTQSAESRIESPKAALSVKDPL